MTTVTFHERKRGFTLLISVLVASVLLALGFAIYNIVSKEIILSSSGRESQFAFYAADTGIECALYWDTHHDAFSLNSALPSITCGEAAVPSMLDIQLIGNIRTTTFQFSLGSELSDPCVRVTVERMEDVVIETKVEALGYNTCVESNPRRIERAIRVQY
jgi:Tfp pilus assembly protein PilX